MKVLIGKIFYPGSWFCLSLCRDPFSGGTQLEVHIAGRGRVVLFMTEKQAEARANRFKPMSEQISAQLGESK